MLACELRFILSMFMKLEHMTVPGGEKTVVQSDNFQIEESVSVKFIDHITAHEDWLMERILGYAINRGYAKYTSTLKEPWRLSISGLSNSLVEAIKIKGRDLELKPDENYAADPAAKFGIAEAKLHRERGINLAMFLGLMKYYQQAYIDLIKESSFSEMEKLMYENLLNRFFNRVEIGFCSTWSTSSEEQLIDELQDRNRQMTNEKNKYLTIFESLSMPVFIVNPFGKIEGMNLAASRFFNFVAAPGENYYGNDRDELDFVVEFPWLKDIYEDFLQRSENKVVYEKTISDPTQYYYISCSRSLDISNKFQGAIFVVEDITNRKKMEKELEKLATTDPLTGAKNRRYFLQFFEQEITRLQRYNKPFALLLLDVDHFKTINDKHGHDIGDKVLKNLVVDSLSVLRDSDIFARWGGEEFIILLPESNVHETSTVAERLRSKLSKAEIIGKEGALITYTVSIGMRVVNQEETDLNVNDLIREADESLYMAKKKGRNRVVMI
jgi:diguanylate cyclase (GGDEF)-like protein